MNEVVISILIPTYNRFNDLKKLLITLHPLVIDFEDSIEIVIGNDNPSDNKKINKFINTLSSFNSRSNIKLVESVNNVGIYKNRLSLLNNSSGEFIIFCDDDDNLSTHLICDFIRNYQYETNKLKYLNTVFVYDVLEYYHNLKDGTNFIKSKYKSSLSKGRMAIAIAGSIFHRTIFEGHLDKYSEYLDKLDHSKNIGEDQIFYNYFKTIAKTIEKELVTYRPLYLANYDKEKDHMMLTNQKENTIEKVNKFKHYVPI